MTQEQALDREERMAWRDAQKTLADVQKAKLHAEANEKKRADEIHIAEIQAEEKKRSDEIQIQIQMAKIEADKELTLKRKLKPVPMLWLIHLLVTEMLSPRVY